MHKERSVGFNIEPLKSEFIVNWLTLYGVTPFVVELKAIRAIDQSYMEIMNDRRGKASDQNRQQSGEAG